MNYKIFLGIMFLVTSIVSFFAGSIASNVTKDIVGAPLKKELIDVNLTICDYQVEDGNQVIVFEALEEFDLGNVTKRKVKDESLIMLLFKEPDKYQVGSVRSPGEFMKGHEIIIYHGRGFFITEADDQNIIVKVQEKI